MAEAQNVAELQDIAPLSVPSPTQPHYPKTSSLDSSFPILVPYNPALFYPAAKFSEYVLSELRAAEDKDAGTFPTEAAAKARGESIKNWQAGRSLEQDIDDAQSTAADTVMTGTETTTDGFSVVDGADTPAHSTAGDDAPPKYISESVETVVPIPTPTPAAAAVDPKAASPFVSALLGITGPKDTGCWGPVTTKTAPENMQLTTNGMPSHTSTLHATLDLFNDLQGDVSNPTLLGLLERAWAQDQLETLKVIFNARSIHLGKGEKVNFYKCIGWLARFAGVRGKATVIANLEWVAKRTIIKPKKEAKKEGDEKKEEVEKGKKEGEEAEEEELDPNDPVFSHGYWKDLANILVLDARGALDVTHTINKILNPPKKGKKGASSDSDDSDDEEKEKKPPVKLTKAQRGAKIEADKQRKAHLASLTRQEKRALGKDARHQKERENHQQLFTKFAESPFYRSLHLATARAFAIQLKQDLDLLKSGDKKQQRKITFAAKWAPSLESFHDKNTLLATSIAEYLFPPEHPAVSQYAGDRVTYLKHAREQYRRVYLSPLRKQLAIVERDISANNFDKINYRRVPSLAMNKYKTLFATRDSERFIEYLGEVTKGTATISGAVLTPASLVHRALSLTSNRAHRGTESAEAAVEQMILNGQWESLVRSVKEQGTMENSLAVVDVSGSMTHPTNADGTNPLHAAIGLGLLLSEVSEEPFKNLMVTFNDVPELVRVDGLKVGETAPPEPEKQPKFTKKVEIINQMEWGMNTDFLAVFERLLLPLALKHKLKQEDMVKKVFVFSDMGFDEANITIPPEGTYKGKKSGKRPWETGHERLVRKYQEHGYELPEMVYWNLSEGANVNGKPVTGETKGCIMLSGCGAGTLKAFVERGLGAEEEEEEEVVEEKPEEEEEVEEDEDEEMVIVDAEDAEEDAGDASKRKAGDMEVDTPAPAPEAKTKTVVKKRKIDPITAMRKLLANPAYEGLQIVG